MFARVPSCGEIVILPDSVRLVYKQSVVTRNRRQALSLSLTQCPHWSKRTFDSLVPADVLLSLLSIDWQIASC